MSVVVLKTPLDFHRSIVDVYGGTQGSYLTGDTYTYTSSGVLIPHIPCSKYPDVKPREVDFVV